jgi:hypothetical protein
MKKLFRMTSVAIILSVLFFSYAYAEKDVSEGYDENTEMTIRGTIKDVGRDMRGPLIVLLQTGGRAYKVVTAPPWFIAQEGMELRPGGSYEVTGSKFISDDGTLYIIASRIEDLSTGKITFLRDTSCMPRWRGRGMMRGMR